MERVKRLLKCSVPICSRCGSLDVARRMDTCWSRKGQRWEPCDPHSDVDYCEEEACHTSLHFVDVEVADTLACKTPEAIQAVIENYLDIDAGSLQLLVYMDESDARHVLAGRIEHIKAKCQRLMTPEIRAHLAALEL